MWVQTEKKLINKSIYARKNGKVGKRTVHTLEFSQSLDACELITFYYLARVEAHDEEVFCLFKELPGKD